MQIYERIKKLMENKGISKSTLAEETNINFNTLRGYLDSGNNIPISALKAISKALDTSVSYLIGETEIEKFNDKEAVLKLVKKIILEYKIH